MDAQHSKNYQVARAGWIAARGDTEAYEGRSRIALDDGMVEALAVLFPDASGRDIKGLAKLAAKYCQHKACLPTLDVFKRCAIFRGMDQMHDPAS